MTYLLKNESDKPQTIETRDGRVVAVAPGELVSVHPTVGRWLHRESSTPWRRIYPDDPEYVKKGLG